MKRASCIWPSVLVLLSAPLGLAACGGGVPVRLTIDEFTMEVSLDKTMDTLFGQFAAQGLFPAGSRALPVLWPASLPDIQYRAMFTAPPVPVDLTPEPGTPEADKYAQINKVKNAIRRIEINRLILRLEQNSLTVALPELKLQIADEPTASPLDRLAWRTVGVLPAAEAGAVSDLELEFVPSGESFLDGQLSDAAKELAIRIVGKVDIDTAREKRLPSGRAVVRLILVATFFVEPDKVL